MLAIFEAITLIICVVLVICAIQTLKFPGPKADALRMALIIAMVALVSYLIHISADNKTLSSICFSIFSISIDWVILSYYIFIRYYTGKVEVAQKEAKISLNGVMAMAVLCGLDTINLALNPITGHVAKIEQSRMMLTGEPLLTATDFTIFYQAHLVTSYIVVISAAYYLIYAQIKASSFYVRKYAAVIAAFAVLLVMDGASVFLGLSVNVGILAYGFVAAFSAYFALFYEPKHLMVLAQTAILNASEAAIICYDDRGKLIYSNDKMAQIYGLDNPTAEDHEKFFAEKVSADPKYFMKDWTKTDIFELNGETKYYEVKHTVINGERGKYAGCYITFTDRTLEYRTHQEEIEAVNRANMQKTNFLSRVSHDIRTPVNSITGMNEMILREATDPAIKEYAKNIKDAVAILSTLISDVLDFSKIESGKMELFEREYNTAELLKGIINIISVQAKSRGLEFTYDIAPTLPSVLKGDDVKISQIIINLLNNAVKYTPEGSVHLKIESRRIMNERVELTISVKDTGKGISEENLPKLFNAFERIEDFNNHSIEGTGLGLNIVSSFLQLMDSELQVASRLGKGSNFWFVVNQEVINDKACTLDVEEYKPKTNDIFIAPWARILVVDDNAMNRKVFKSLLKRNMIQITEAASGAQCLNKIAENEYDLIFMDHMMPEMDGIETYRKMKEMSENLNQNTPVLMLTANVVQGAEEQYMAEGFSGFLTKPVDPDALEETIIKYLRK